MGKARCLTPHPRLAASPRLQADHPIMQRDMSPQAMHAQALAERSRFLLFGHYLPVQNISYDPINRAENRRVAGSIYYVLSAPHHGSLSAIKQPLSATPRTLFPLPLNIVLSFIWLLWKYSLPQRYRLSPTVVPDIGQSLLRIRPTT